jgi:hypothetical protein
VTRVSVALAALLLPLAAHAASPSGIAINTPSAFSITTPSGFAPAPVPNQDITSPKYIGDGGPTWSGGLKEPRIVLRSGDGYTPNSNFSQDLERRSRGIAPGLAPSLSIKFPLD